MIDTTGSDSDQPKVDLTVLLFPDHTTKLEKSPLKWGGNFYSDATDREGERRGPSVPKSNGAFSFSLRMCISASAAQREYKRDICYYRGRKHMLRSANLIHCKPDITYPFFPEEIYFNTILLNVETKVTLQILIGAL